VPLLGHEEIGAAIVEIYFQIARWHSCGNIFIRFGITEIQDLQNRSGYHFLAEWTLSPELTREWLANAFKSASHFFGLNPISGHPGSPTHFFHHPPLKEYYVI
jgi:hypothetical protein